ncbi:SRPBCC family protein [Paraburkholderia sp. J12]|uniref:SRPBCC family protein n=1 Tax=Paraburkholderia sp. J12 TaxID=2805432 RepID=UPI002ABE542B|nr:SRPBCC family protein [Paraburkholderia sp. J12]
MTSVVRELTLNLDAARAWDALRDPGNVGNVFAGVLVDAVIDGDLRTVTFANASVVQERVIAIDESRMRIAYTVCGDRFEHHHASIQVFPDTAGRCRVVWISDFLPDARREVVEPLMDAGCAALVRNVR